MGVLGIVVSCLGCHMQGVATSRFTLVCHRQAGISACRVLIEATGKHIQGDVHRPGAAIGVGNGQLRARLGVVGGALLDRSFHGIDFNVCDGQIRNDYLCGAKNLVPIGDGNSILAGGSVIVGIQRPLDIGIIIQKRCFTIPVRRNNHIDTGLHSSKGIRCRGSASDSIFQRTRQLRIFSGSR